MKLRAVNSPAPLGMQAQRLFLFVMSLVFLIHSSVTACADDLTPNSNLDSDLPEHWIENIQRSLSEREYWANNGREGLQAPNRAHGFRTFFDGSGVQIQPRTPADCGFARNEHSRLSISLARIGKGGELTAPPPGAVWNEGPRVELHRDGLIEWYVNAPVGLEHGFTIAERVPGTDELVLELAIGGAEARQSGADVELTTPCGLDLHYGGLVTVDARGAHIPSRLEVVDSSHIRIVVRDTHASYPLVVDPLLTSNVDTQIEGQSFLEYLGVSVASAGDVNGDGYSDIIVGVERYDSGETDEGAALIYLGSASGIANGNPSTASAILESNQSSSMFGFRVAGAGDVNGDGYSDVIVGAYLYDAGESDEGAAFVFLGGPSGIASGDPGSAAATLQSNQSGVRFGYGVAGAGDINGDGFGDVVVGAPFHDQVTSDRGAAFVFLGSSTGVANGNPGTAATVIQASTPLSDFGLSVDGAGDVNGDGFADIVVGAPRCNCGATNDGAAYVFHGSASGIASGVPGSAAAQLFSNAGSAQYGTSVAGIGDVNGDGFSDIAVGAIYYPNSAAAVPQTGAAFVHLGSASGVTGGNASLVGALLVSDQNQSEMGHSVDGAGDVNGDGYADLIVGARRYEAGQATEGAAFVYLGGASGIASGDVGDADFHLQVNDIGGEAGTSVAGAGDVDGDGFGDVLVGARQWGGNNQGAAFLYRGGALGIVDANPATAATLLESDQAGAELGLSVAAAGDVNGDGYSDVIVGASLYDAGQADEGAAFVFHGSATGLVGTAPMSAATQLESNQGASRFGASVAGAGDVNSDGFADVIVGASEYDAGESDEGAAFVYHGSASGVGVTAATQLESNQGSAQFGSSVAAAGDVNGDGFGDVIVGARWYDAPESEEGAAFLFLGSDTGVANGNPSTARAQLESNQANAEAGVSVASAGDIDGDGFADIIVGASLYDAGAVDEGAAWIFLGSPSAIDSGGPLEAAAQLESDQAGAQFGAQVSTAGDVDGDGFSDVVVGAPLYDAGQGVGEGAAFVFLGGSTGIQGSTPGTASAQLESDQASANLGAAVASAGDVNGDGFADLLIGAPGYDASQGVGEGAAFVFLGSSSGIANAGAGSAAAQIESDQASAALGASVAGVGDVDGDGHADLLVGSQQYDGGMGAGEGAALLLLGNGGVSGRVVLGQQREGGGSDPVVAWGRSEAIDGFRVRTTATHPTGRGRVKLQIESCATGLPFGDPACSLQTSAGWTDSTATTGGVVLEETLAGLGGASLARLYRWRARVLHAPYSVTESGIISAPNPMHGPWRRLLGQALEADIRISLAGDADADGVPDTAETESGVYVDSNDVGTHPFDPDSDGDGLVDGDEVPPGLDPNEADSDADGYCDGNLNGEGACTAGDNCPYVSNAGQENSDSQLAGDACQCGDVAGDNGIDATDLQRIREQIVGATSGGPFDPDHCDVDDDGVCGVSDAYIVQRVVGGEAPSVIDTCVGYFGP